MKISIDESRRVSLYGEEFAQMRSLLDEAISNVMAVMRDRNTNSAAITLKIDVSLINTPVSDAGSPMGRRVAIAPEIGFKITTTLTSKSEQKQDIVKIEDGKEIVQDANGAYYIVTNEDANGQMSMFDHYEEDYSDADV